MSERLRTGHPVEGSRWPDPMSKFELSLDNPSTPVEQWPVACPACGRGGAFWLSPYSASLVCRWCPYVLEEDSIRLGPHERFEYLRPLRGADPFLYVTRYDANG